MIVFSKREWNLTFQQQVDDRGTIIDSREETQRLWIITDSSLNTEAVLLIKHTRKKHRLKMNYIILIQSDNSSFLLELTISIFANALSCLHIWTRLPSESKASIVWNGDKTLSQGFRDLNFHNLIIDRFLFNAHKIIICISSSLYRAWIWDCLCRSCSIVLRRSVFINGFKCSQIFRHMLLHEREFLVCQGLL